MGTTRSTRRMARPSHVGNGADLDVDAMPAAEAAPPAKPITKQSNVIELLQREGGASLDAIVEATGWLPHTARAALTGLRKKGHAIERTLVEGQSRYALVQGAAE